MAKKILFRALIEVLGKPKEHVEKSLKGYVEKLKQDKKYQVISEDYAETKKRDKEELWATFAELEIKATDIDDLIGFCFDYMPSSIEVIEPNELGLSNVNISHFLSNLQARLHQVDMVAKQVKLENDHLRKTASALLKNYLQVLLAKNNLTSDQLSKLTGVNKDKLEDFLDKLIDEGKIELKGGIYKIKGSSKKSKNGK